MNGQQNVKIYNYVCPMLNVTHLQAVHIRQHSHYLSVQNRKEAPS